MTAVGVPVADIEKQVGQLRRCQVRQDRFQHALSVTREKEGEGIIGAGVVRRGILMGHSVMIEAAVHEAAVV